MSPDAAAPVHPSPSAKPQPNPKQPNPKQPNPKQPNPQAPQPPISPNTPHLTPPSPRPPSTPTAPFPLPPPRCHRSPLDSPAPRPCADRTMTTARRAARLSTPVAPLTPLLLLLSACSGSSSSDDAPAPTPRVTAPVSGTLLAGSTEITWSGFGGTGSLSIELSTDGGATFTTTVVAATADDRSFTWDTTTAPDTTQARLRLTGADAVATSGAFSLDNTAPTAALTAPVGAELLGASATITWTTTDAHPGTVRIDASTDSGATFTIPVAADAPDTGSFTWDTSALTDAATYRVRVTPIDGAGNEGAPAVSPADFTIDATAPVIALTAPTGGELLFGETDITWTTTDANPGTVAITASLDGGTTFDQTIASAAPDTGSFRWDTATLPDTSALRIRVVATDGAGNASAASDSAADVTADNLRLVGPAHYQDANGNASLDSGDTILLRFDEAVAINSPIASDFDLPVTGNSLGAGAAITLGTDPATLLITLGTNPVLRTRGAFDAADVDTNSPSALEIADPLTADAIESVATGVDAAALGPVDLAPAPSVLSTVAAGARTPGRGALGDLNGDGDLDLVVAVTGGDASELWIGDGALGWTLGQSFSAADARDVAAGDVDGDGDLDVVLAVAGGNEVWTNDGSGTLSNSGQSLGSSNSTAVALADLDGDGDLDAFFGNGGNQPDRVWINGGTGLFVDSGQTLETTLTTDVAAGDVDADGDLDLLFTVSDGAAGVWLNDGGALFSAVARFGSVAEGLSLADLDRDGQLDAIFAGSGLATVALGTGGGGFAAAQALGTGDHRAVTPLDVDGDGDLDLFAARSGDEGQFWINDGSGAFALDTFTAPADPATDALAAPLDADGDMDLVVLGDMAGLRPLRGSAAGGQPAANYGVETLTQGPWTSGVPARGDVNGDGVDDLVVPDIGFGLRLLLGDGAGYTEGADFGTSAAREVTLFDADGDGDLDALERRGAPGADADALWLGDGSGAFIDAGLTLGLDTFAPGDLDGDGDADLVAFSASAMETWDGDGFGGFSPSGQSLALTGLALAAFGDMDRDGDLDVVFASAASLQVLENDGVGGFTSGATLAGFTDTTALALADFDRDGDLDVLQASSATSTGLRWARNDGGLAFAPPQTAASVQNAFVGLTPANLDEDGDLDLVAVDSTNQALFLLTGNGNGTFQAGPGIGILDLSAVVPVDADQDGDLDLYVARGADATPNATADQLRRLD